MWSARSLACAAILAWSGLFTAGPSRATSLPFRGVLDPLNTMPRDSTRTLQAVLREQDATFRIAFDSLLAAVPRWTSQSGLDLDFLASEHSNVVHDSLLARDLRTVRRFPAKQRLVWWHGVRADAEGRRRYSLNQFPQ